MKVINMQPLFNHSALQIIQGKEDSYSEPNTQHIGALLALMDNFFTLLMQGTANHSALDAGL